MAFFYVEIIMALGTGVSRANANKAVRQEALREQLSKQKHVEQVIVNINDLENLGRELTNGEINRLKIAIEARQRLISKYLPDLKAVEITADVEHDIRVSSIQIQVIDSVGTDD